MNAKGLLFVAPLILVMVTSGCTVPYLNVQVPCILPGFGCTVATEQTSDVVVIKSMEALPVKTNPDGQIKVVAYIQNVGDESIPQPGVGIDNKVEVSLYDYCTGLFTLESTQCGADNAGGGDGKCTISSLNRGEAVPVYWTLKARSKDIIPVVTTCDLKASVSYAYKTSATSAITFIDYDEYQRQLAAGTFNPITSYISEGYGPVKPYITVEGEQPIPSVIIDKNSGERKITANLAFQAVNKGTGILVNNNICYENIEVENQKMADQIKTCISNCAQTSGPCQINSYASNWETSKIIPFIKKETSKCKCQVSIDATNLERTQTEYVTSRLTYFYEFRKSLTVTVEPKQ